MRKYNNLVSITKLVFDDHVTILYDINPIFTDRKQRAEKYKLLDIFYNEVFPNMSEQEKNTLCIVMDSHDKDRINTFMNEIEILTAIRAAKKQLNN